MQTGRRINWGGPFWTTKRSSSLGRTKDVVHCHRIILPSMVISVRRMATLWSLWYSLQVQISKSNCTTRKWVFKVINCFRRKCTRAIQRRKWILEELLSCWVLSIRKWVTSTNGLRKTRNCWSFPTYSFSSRYNHRSIKLIFNIATRAPVVIQNKGSNLFIIRPSS